MWSAQLIELLPDTPDQHTQLVDLAMRRSAMLIDMSSRIADLDALESDTLDPTTWGLPAKTVLPPAGAAVDLDAAPMPGLEVAGRGQISGSAWYLSAGLTPAEEAAAWTFMTWWNQPEQQAQWSLESSYLPYTDAAVSNEQVQQQWGHTRAGRWLDTAYTEMTDFDTQNPGPLIGPYASVRAAVVEAITMVTSANMDPQVALDETDPAITAELTEYQLAHS
jgi:ABC-type glycerol-3-phosphate transport system substrate-binding protein